MILLYGINFARTQGALLLVRKTTGALRALYVASIGTAHNMLFLCYIYIIYLSVSLYARFPSGVALNMCVCNHHISCVQTICQSHSAAPRSAAIVFHWVSPQRQTRTQKRLKEILLPDRVVQVLYILCIIVHIICSFIIEERDAKHAMVASCQNV